MVSYLRFFQAVPKVRLAHIPQPTAYTLGAGAMFRHLPTEEI